MRINEHGRAVVTNRVSGVTSREWFRIFTQYRLWNPATRRHNWTLAADRSSMMVISRAEWPPAKRRLARCE